MIFGLETDVYEAVEQFSHYKVYSFSYRIYTAEIASPKKQAVNTKIMNIKSLTFILTIKFKNDFVLERRLPFKIVENYLDHLSIKSQVMNFDLVSAL